MNNYPMHPLPRVAVHNSGRSLLREALLLLGATSICSFLLSWLHYPVENSFSILTDTISHLGSPDAHRNPSGYSFFRLGFARLCILMGCAAYQRHERMPLSIYSQATVSTRLYFCGIFCLALTIFVPDSGALLFSTLRYQVVHGGIAIAAIVCFALAILRDAWFLKKLTRGLQLGAARWSNKFTPCLIPFAIFIFLFVVGLSCIGIWEIRCSYNPNLDHWPGEGIFSMALWEWILFSYLVLFMYWFPQLLPKVRYSRSD